MSPMKSRFVRRIAFGLGVFSLCGSALADPAIVQIVAVGASFVLPAFAPVFLLASPVIGESAVRRKEGKLS